MHQRAARAHPVDGERSIGKLVQLARLEIAKKLMPLSAGQRARVDAAAEGG
jgi:DNA-directed RNA polymerase subunit K/omega